MNFRTKEESTMVWPKKKGKKGVNNDGNTNSEEQTEIESELQGGGTEIKLPFLCCLDWDFDSTFDLDKARQLRAADISQHVLIFVLFLVIIIS